MTFSALSLGLAEDPDRPVFTAFVKVCVQRWNAAGEILQQLLALPRDAPDTPRTVKDGGKKAAQLLQEAGELSAWLFPAREPMNFSDALSYAEKLKQQGWPENFPEDMFRLVQKRDVGRPHKREIFLKAFELQLQSKAMTLGKVTLKLCPCGETHGPKCQQSIKGGIRSLKPLVRTHAPDLLKQYESLHPDRATLGRHRLKKVNG